MTKFYVWLESQEPFDRSVLKGLYSKLNTPDAKGQHPLRSNGMFVNIDPAEMQHFRQMVEFTKQKLITELKGSLNQSWLQYQAWEQKNAPVMLRFVRGGGLSPLIKNGGKGTPVQESGKDQSGYGYISVPTELYNVLYWRQQVKDAEAAIAENHPGTIHKLLPLFSQFHKT